jgi:hypothetical protein
MNAVLGTDAAPWFANVYQQKWWHHRLSTSTVTVTTAGASPQTDPLEELLPSEAVQLDAMLALFAPINSDSTLAGAVSLRSGTGTDLHPPPSQLRQLLTGGNEVATKDDSPEDGGDGGTFAQLTARGETLVLRVERLARCLVDSIDPTAPPPPLVQLQRTVSKAFGITTVWWLAINHPLPRITAPLLSVTF